MIIEIWVENQYNGLAEAKNQERRTGFMAIIYQEKSNSFMLNTPNTSYVIGIADAEKFVGHAYYGQRLSEDDVTYLMRTGEAPLPRTKTAVTDFPF